MFGIAPSELMIVGLFAIIFVGPKDLPRAMRLVGQWVGKGRALTRHVHGAIDQVIREIELAELENKWQSENDRIMHEHADLIGGSVGSAAQIATREVTAKHPPEELQNITHAPVSAAVPGTRPEP